VPDPLDAHAHLDVRAHAEAFEQSGCVLAQTMSLAEAQAAHGRADSRVCWGVGCHPRLAQAQARFSRDVFAGLIQTTAVVGEVGLDSGSRVAVADQLLSFRSVLDIVAEQPRLVSIHSFRATSAVLDELERRPIAAPIMHWWTGRADETRRAVRLGCYFSIHSAVARRSVFPSLVPLDRILVESDHGLGDPPAAIPLRVGWVEHLAAQRYGVTPVELRRQGWRNLAELVRRTATADMLPVALRGALALA
jgi:TatD DNase family protein